MNLKQGLPTPLRRLILALTGATMAVSYTWAQTAPAPSAADQSQTNATTAGPAAGMSSPEVVKLSPFEVKAENVGYFAPNSTAGTRFNTPIEDLASSLTVVTPAQMKDFAMLDINDVFLYTASTEGTGTYTDFTVDRNGSVSDNVSLDPNNANRIRGLSASNIAFDNFDMTGRMPIDPTIIDSLEVSRGPNATIFGLGNPSGTINQVAATANMEHNHAEVQARYDSFDGYRSSLDVNRVLLQNKLAVRVSGVFQRQGYVLKPSGTNTVRYNAMVKYQPFKGTTISGGIYYYRMNGNRPNALPPRDNVSYWLASGKPTWNPVTQMVTLNGVQSGPYTSSSKLPTYFIDTFTGSTHDQIFIDGNGSVGYWSVPQTTNSTDPINPSTLATVTSGTIRFVAPNSAANAVLGRLGNQPLFTTTPTVSDKSIYDWSKINIASLNRIMDRDVVSEVKLDQYFLDTPTQSLVGQAAFLREDTQRYQRNLVNTANDNGQSGQLFVDVNQTLLDGSPNPYFLRPYIGTDQPRTVWAPAKWDTYRAQLLYTLDLTDQKSWLKWLGRHQLAGYDEYKYQINRQYSYKDAIANNLSWIPAGTPRGNPQLLPVLCRRIGRLCPVRPLELLLRHLSVRLGRPKRRLPHRPGGPGAGRGDGRHRRRQRPQDDSQDDGGGAPGPLPRRLDCHHVRPARGQAVREERPHATAPQFRRDQLQLRLDQQLGPRRLRFQQRQDEDRRSGRPPLQGAVPRQGHVRGQRDPGPGADV